MNDEIVAKLGQLIDLQDQITKKSIDLQNLLVPYFGTNNPVVWANKYSKDQLESMRSESSRAFAMWGVDEEELLVEMQNAGLELFVIAKALGRTESSVRGKLNKMRLS
jgi:hypothetical protein